MGEQSTMLFIFTTVTVLFVSARWMHFGTLTNTIGAPIFCLRPARHAHNRIPGNLVRSAPDQGVWYAIPFLQLTLVGCISGADSKDRSLYSWDHGIVRRDVGPL
jgi:hypothetical protein